jgi:hypothetical protein
LAFQRRGINRRRREIGGEDEEGTGGGEGTGGEGEEGTANSRRRATWRKEAEEQARGKGGAT